VYADSPARVTDFLSAVEGIDADYDRSTELLTTLLHIDERYAENLARKIEAIRTPSQAHRLRTYIEEVRSEGNSSWLPDVDDLSYFLDSSSPDETSSTVED
jgi:Mn-dependent DtxR family transcriptional regulator